MSRVMTRAFLPFLVLLFVLNSVSFPKPNNLSSQPLVASAMLGGPVVLMGIDAEDGGPGSHGDISVYVSVVNSILDNVTRGGNVAVIGAGKEPSDDVTKFWLEINVHIGAASVEFVNGPTDILNHSFADNAMIAVVSSGILSGVNKGGLTQAENDALVSRQSEIAGFVYSGGGLLGFSQTDFSNPYAYLVGIGNVTSRIGLGYMNITPTPEGASIGITDALDVCCWHDEYLMFPDFLQVLALNAGTGNAAAIGGLQVVPPFTNCCIDDSSGSMLQWFDDGAFKFTSSTGAMVTGYGSVMKHGCLVRLSATFTPPSSQPVPSALTVRVQALRDTMSGSCTASLIAPATLDIVKTITDRPGMGPDCP